MLARTLRTLSITASTLAALALQAPEARAAPPHLDWAVLLVDNVLPEHNAYGTSPNYVLWAGVGGATLYENRSQCNSFLTQLLRQGYGWTSSDILAWLGSTSPTAAMYHDAIAAEDGWELVLLVADLVPGDVIAIRYPPGGSVTGHVATVVSAPVLRVPTKPLVAGTDQFEVEVADSSSTGHGPLDTRLLPDGTWDAGAGIGVMRLYTDATLAVVGHTWSTGSGSVFYDQSTRHVVLGRLAP
jgi:hypothetical protein